MSRISVQIANNTKLNHRNTVLQLIDEDSQIIGKFLKIIWKKSKMGGGELLILEGFLVFSNFR